MKQFFRGSVLVYTLFILMMLLVSGLALATVTLMQQRGATGLGDSVNAFQAANDGFEDLIARYKHASGTTLSAIGSCTNASGVGIISQSIGGRDYVATFQKKDASGNLMSASCADNLFDIEQVKVVATVGSSTRAIETAFAASGDNSGCVVSVNTATYDHLYCINYGTGKFCDKTIGGTVGSGSNWDCSNVSGWDLTVGSVTCMVSTNNSAYDNIYCTRRTDGRICVRQYGGTAGSSNAWSCSTKSDWNI